jgi:hypothetical protein
MSYQVRDRLLCPLRTIRTLPSIPRALPPDFLAEIRRRVEKGEYNTTVVAEAVARALFERELADIR